MTDILNVRDHSQPCEHGYNGSHDDGFAPSGAVDSEQDMDDGWCPGGKEITLRRMSPDEAWSNVQHVYPDGESYWIRPVYVVEVGGHAM